MANLTDNTASLQEVLDILKNKAAGGSTAELPTLNNPAIAAELLNGKELIDDKGNIITGTMSNKGAVSDTLTATKTSYTIPEGYHNGQGQVSIVTETKTVVPKTTAQTVYPSTGKLLSLVNVAGITNQKTDDDITVSGATVNIPAGYYASAINTSIGTVEQATPTIKVSSSGLITATSTQAAGYVSEGETCKTLQLSANQDNNFTALNIKNGVTIFGTKGLFTYDANAEAADITSGKIAYVKGKKVTGTKKPVLFGTYILKENPTYTTTSSITQNTEDAEVYGYFYDGTDYVYKQIRDITIESTRILISDVDSDGEYIIQYSNYNQKAQWWANNTDDGHLLEGSQHRIIDVKAPLEVSQSFYDLFMTITALPNTTAYNIGRDTKNILYGTYVLSKNPSYKAPQSQITLEPGQDKASAFLLYAATREYFYRTNLRFIASSTGFKIQVSNGLDATWYSNSQWGYAHPIFGYVSDFPIGDQYRVIDFKQPIKVTKEFYEAFMSLVENPGTTAYNIGRASALADIIYFSIDATKYCALRGMTFEEWCNSSGNTDGYWISGMNIHDAADEFYLVDNAESSIHKNEVIEENEHYFTLSVE